MGAVAQKVEHHHHHEAEAHPAGVPERSGLPQRPQVMEVLAMMLAGPGAVTASFTTCLCGMWAMNGGGETAFAVMAGALTVFGLSFGAVVVGALSDQG